MRRARPATAPSVSGTMLLPVGHGAHAFSLEREVGSFLLTTHGMQIPEET